ncbi:MAG: IS110 family transposase [Bacteroidales bacterium]|nr:IS110 family transposase [Bacteroidales bacterium]
MEYPTPEDILRVPKEDLYKELSKISRGRFNENKVIELIENAKCSIGVKQGLEGYKSSLQAYIGQIALYLSQIKNIEKQIEEKLSFLPEYTILRTVGLGKISIATIVSEIGEFKNFKTSKELLKYSGLNLVENSSGNFRGRKRISKIGNEHLRSILYFATLRLIKKGGIYYDLYQKHQEKGMEKKKAIISIARKLLRTIHAITKKEKIFIKEYELRHFNKAA